MNLMLVHTVATLDTAGCGCEFHVGILPGNLRHYKFIFEVPARTTNTTCLNSSYQVNY